MHDASIPNEAAAEPVAATEWVRPKVLLRRMRSNCASEGPIWKWTLPAFAGKLTDGRSYNTCPSAGICADICFARAGTFNIPSVAEAHRRNLQYVLDEPKAWKAQILKELEHPRFHPGDEPVHVRIHDAGDWFSEWYLAMWIDIMNSVPDILFYNYTKEVELLERVVRPAPPPNFFWRYSYGGTQDELIAPHHAHADVFPDEEAVTAAGYTSQTPSDLLAAYGPRELGIAANKLPAQRKKQGDRSFRALQRAANARAAGRRFPRRGPGPRRPTGHTRRRA
ncbi:GP88 family protein [Streptomyces decoyicus]